MMLNPNFFFKQNKKKKITKITWFCLKKDNSAGDEI